MTDSEIGSLIRQSRKKVGMTQSELAAALGVTWEMVSRYERGKSSALLKLLDIARILGVPLSYFFAEAKNGLHVSQPVGNYVTELFVPIISYVSPELQDLYAQLRLTTEGSKVIVPPSMRIHFALKLGEGSNVRVTSPALLPKGLALCRFVERELQGGDTVLVSKNGLVSIDVFPVLQGTILAQVVEWVVRL